MNQNFIDLNFEDQFNHISKLSHSGQFEEAHKKCEFLHSYNKDHILVKFCLARLKVSLGKKEDWLRGLELFDSIRGHGVFGGEMLSQKKQLIPLEIIDKSINGKKIFIALEGGLGDQICFARFANDLITLGADIIIGTKSELFPVLRSLNT